MRSGPNLTSAIFSAGGSTSLEWAPKFEEAGSIVIDNSSAWRMSPRHKLIVPEINAQILRIDDRIIAKPQLLNHPKWYWHWLPCIKNTK